MKALIMAGGQGSRLRPLTCDRPKPMVPILGRPIMEHIVEGLARAGLRDILVTLHPMPEAVQGHFQGGEAWGVHLRYLVEDAPLGTAGSVARCRPLVDDTLVVVSGDALTDIDLAEAIRFHRRRKSAATLVLKPVPDPSEYGIVVTDSEGRIRRFLEKPGRGEVFSDYANTGIYILEPSVLDGIPPGLAVDFSKDVFPRLLEAGEPLFGFVAEGYWSDIGTPEQYRQAHLDALGGKLAHLAPARPEAVRAGAGAAGDGTGSAPGVRVEPGARIAPKARLAAPCWVGPGCDVEDGAEVGPFACLGRGCHVSRGATVRHSVLWNGCFLGPAAEVRGAVLADGVVVGRGARIYEGAVLGRGCRIGEAAVVAPGVRLWPDKQVDPFEHVSRPVVWNGTRTRSVVGPLGVRGLANVELTPEMACGVAGAFAATLPPGSRVVVASAGGEPARALAWAAAAGAAAAGSEVVWLDELSVPEARMAVSLAAGDGSQAHNGSSSAAERERPRGAAVREGSEQADRRGHSGGLYIHVSGARGDEGTARLRLWDARGVELGPEQARAVDGAFRREEWRRAGPQAMGGIRPGASLKERARVAYLGALMEWAGRLAAGAGPVPGGADGKAARSGTPGHEALRRGETDVAVVTVGALGQRPGPGRRTLVEALRALGVQVRLGPAGALAKGAALEPGPPESLLFAAEVDETGERLELWDPELRPLPRSTVDALTALVAAEEAALSASKGALRLPPWAGDGADHVAGRLGLPVVRTFAHPAALLDAPTAGPLHPALDGVALACALAVLAKARGGLGALVADLPRRTRLELELPVALDRMGRVMRRLAERAAAPTGAGPGLDESLRASDGLRVRHDRGWALVRPDPDRPLVQVHVEAATVEDARDLLAHYASLVRQAAEP